VTFDDGYASTLRAVPILAELGFPGTVFLVTAFVDSGERLSWQGIDGPAEAAAGDELRPLTWEDAERLVEAGWEVGSHTVRHPLLTRLDDERIDEELRASRAAIAARLGSCTSLSYPYGIADPRVAAAARRAGYDTGCTLTFVELADEPLRRPRTGLDDGDRGLRLRVKLSRPVAASRRTALARLARRARRRRSWIPG
jgi:peptidoglycan/xylan/chitin deacetylase (PgdA/CDA1 family)